MKKMKLQSRFEAGFRGVLITAAIFSFCSAFTSAVNNSNDHRPHHYMKRNEINFLASFTGLPGYYTGLSSDYHVKSFHPICEKQSKVNAVTPTRYDIAENDNSATENWTPVAATDIKSGDAAIANDFDMEQLQQSIMPVNADLKDADENANMDFEIEQMTQTIMPSGTDLSEADESSSVDFDMEFMKQTILPAGFNLQAADESSNIDFEMENVKTTILPTTSDIRTSDAGVSVDFESLP